MMYPCPFYYACMQLQCIAILHPGQFLCASQSDEFNLFFEDNYMNLEYYVTTYIYWTIFMVSKDDTQLSCYSFVMYSVDVHLLAIFSCVKCSLKINESSGL